MRNGRLRKGKLLAQDLSSASCGFTDSDSVEQCVRGSFKYEEWARVCSGACVRVCVLRARVWACLPVGWTAVPSLACPCPLSFSSLPNPPVSWLPYLLPPLSQGVWEWGDTVSLAISRGSAFSFPRQLDPLSPAVCPSTPRNCSPAPVTATCRQAPGTTLQYPGDRSSFPHRLLTATLALLRGCQWLPWEIDSVHEQLTKPPPCSCCSYLPGT